MDFIDEGLAGGGGVLVHCYAGMSRSPTCVIAYLMAVKGLTLDHAWDYVKDIRDIARPNPGFLH